MAEDTLEAMFPAPEEPVTEPTETPPPEPVSPDEGKTLQEAVNDQRDEQLEKLEAKPAPERPEPGFVPIAAVMDERDKRKALEQRIAQYEAAQQSPKAPDPYDNPEEYAAYQNNQLQSALQQQKVDMSWTLAVRDYGKDAAEAARDWARERAERDPVFMQQLDTAFHTETLPIDWLVQQHKRDALLTDIGDPSKLDDWFEREASKRGYARQGATVAAAAPAVAVAQPAPKPTAPPRSIASDAPASSGTASGAVDAFEGLLSR